MEAMIDIVIMQDKGNQACEQAIPTAMPHEMVAAPERDVGYPVLSQEDRLQVFCSESEIN